MHGPWLTPGHGSSALPYSFDAAFFTRPFPLHTLQRAKVCLPGSEGSLTTLTPVPPQAAHLISSSDKMCSLSKKFGS
jgi:hypothetical protein